MATSTKSKSRTKPRDLLTLESDPLWYKDAIIYELHVRSFQDSAGDGIGDFRGLAQRLDYLQDLGITALWLLPFYPSPLKDDGYDIADYMGVHPSYGTLADVKHFLKEAHARGLRVITELVLNHTSDQHPWFQRSRRAKPGDPWRDFYVWSDAPDKYKETRIIFQDFEHSNWTFDHVAGAYFWHRFYSHQPDLNYDNPAVFEAVSKALDFWLDMGIDGLRLDAVPYLYEREGTNCENLPETHEALRRLRRHVDEKFRDRMLLAEANQWPEDSVAYFGAGDECHMAFHFPVMPRMFMAIRMEDRYPLIDILQQTPKIPDLCQWALFLRNHDELTLEMVTDEERDYMYRTYAHDPQMRINLGIRRRLAPLLGNDRNKIELMNGLLFSMPGTPVVYYGDEIGMGDNVYLGDRNGVRTPMQWNSDRNAGFSRANSQRLFLPVVIEPEFHYEAINVEAQQNNPSSLLWWMKKLIALRKRYRAFGRGTLEFLYPDNRKVLAYVRRYEDEIILVVANLSRLAQYVELDLSRFKGMVPMELFGQNDFPPIGELPYLLTLGPHAFYWFALRPARVSDIESTPEAVFSADRLPRIALAGGWEGVFEGRAREKLEEALPAYLRSRRWFGGKARRISSVELADVIPFRHAETFAYIVIARVEYTEGDPDLYALALNFAGEAAADTILRESPQVVLVRLEGKAAGDHGVLYEALRERSFNESLLQMIARKRQFQGSAGAIVASTTSEFRQHRGAAPLEPSLARAEQSNTSVIYGDRFILKLFRRLDEGVNPDLEVSDFLTRRGFPHSPPLAGALEYRREGAPPMTLGVLQNFVRNEGDAWSYTLDTLARYYDHVGTLPGTEPPPVCPAGASLLQLINDEVPKRGAEMVGAYVESARLLGQRTAEMHLALASEFEDSAFAPEPFTTLYQRSIYQSMRNLTGNVMQLLRTRLRHLPERLRPLAQQVLDRESAIQAAFRSIIARKIDAMRTRIHGDYHLGQVLYTGKDFVIIDYEGEPMRAISERRIKRSPLRDVTGMIRSFHYAAYTRLVGEGAGGVVRAEDIERLEPWARCWNTWVAVAYLRSYFATAKEAAFLPRSPEELTIMFNAYLLEKAIYEVGYELNNRPGWVGLPLRGILNVLEGGA
jgi:maltose alpha-D-glucosyltransferase/alpha-amylase